MKEVILDVAKDPYGRRYYAAQKRKAFEKIKRTQAFKDWKRRQWRIQKGKCAYCHVDLTRKKIVTHVDHVSPLYFEGTNDFSNLVLSCRRCNARKWVANNRVVPQWIHRREDEVSLSETRRAQKNVLQEIIKSEIDEQMLDMSMWNNL